jgi:hypothetical protein
MRRALVLIGVSRTGGGLEELKSIQSSFNQLRVWAKEQRFDSIEEISDLRSDDVRLGDIVDLIQNLDDSPTPPDQLVVYFNGHGVRNAFGDLWLLSRAPNQSSEAVNVFASVTAAYYRYFKHVVLISDACRVNPEDKQFNSVMGASIFQNAREEGLANSVDVFFASTVGTPALEIDIAKTPTSIYTLQLSEFLRGSEPSILEKLHPPDILPTVVRSAPLKKALSSAVRARLRKNGVNQNVRPDAILSSDPALWLSSFDHDPPPLGNAIEPTGLETMIVVEGSKSIVDPPPSPSIPQAPISASEEFQGHLEAALVKAQTTTSSTEETWIPVGFHFETQCGFHLKGMNAAGGKLSDEGSISLEGNLVRVISTKPQMALLTLQNESGLLLPVIPNHIGFIQFDSDRITDIAYEPSANFGNNYERQEARYSRFSFKAATIRSVREILATAARTGSLLLAVLSHEQIREIINIAAYSDEGVDAMVLVLLGYGCVASGKQEWLTELCDICMKRLGFLLFDLKLLAETGPHRERVPTARLLPPFPLITQ